MLQGQGWPGSLDLQDWLSSMRERERERERRRRRKERERERRKERFLTGANVSCRNFTMIIVQFVRGQIAEV